MVGGTHAERIPIVKRQAGALRNVTSAVGCVDDAMAPAFSVMVGGAVRMTVHRAYQAERGGEPGCLVQPAYHGLYQLVAGFYGGRSIGDGVPALVSRICSQLCRVLGHRRQMCRRPSPSTWG